MQYIPCFGQVHCVLYDFKPVYGDGLDNEISIIAGHFPWGVWSRLPGYAAVAHNTVPPCFIMFRNPVSRAVSYFYKVIL